MELIFISQCSANPIIGTTSKVGEIQRLIRTLCAPELADAILKQLSVALIANRGNEETGGLRH